MLLLSQGFDDDADDNGDGDANYDDGGDDVVDEFDNLKDCQLRLTNSLNPQHQQRHLKGLHRITQIGQL